MAYQKSKQIISTYIWSNEFSLHVRRLWILLLNADLNHNLVKDLQSDVLVCLGHFLQEKRSILECLHVINVKNEKAKYFFKKVLN